ncbi:MAG: DUF805 domain-containing protein [Sphingomicrobium sp.]
MGETLREAFGLVARTISHTFDFAGRSRRLEIGYYWIASILVTNALIYGLAATLRWPSSVVAKEVAQLIVAIPFFALFVRRLHDHGRSGWWLAVLLPVVPFNIYETLRVNFHAYDPAWLDVGMWKLLLLIPVLLLFAFVLTEGDVGENLYGPDPRLDSPQANPT